MPTLPFPRPRQTSLIKRKGSVRHRDPAALSQSPDQTSGPQHGPRQPLPG